MSLSVISSSPLYPFILGAICICAYYVNSLYALRNTTTIPKGQRFLLVTAHPDDECMFFSPTITNLLAAGNQVSVLCLSNGDADGLGKIRVKELVRSCSMLGCQAHQRDTLVDSMSEKWDIKVIVREITQHVKEHPVDAFITFDEHGVSGHPNHISILPAIREYRKNTKSQALIWKLRSTTLVRKYIGLGDVMPSLILATWRVAVTPGKRSRKKDNQMCLMGDPIQTLRGQRAMVFGHWSQMRWFRWFWVVIGRYMYINELSKVIEPR